MRLQQRLGDLTALVAGEVAGLAGEDRHVGRLGLDRVVEPLLAVVGGRGADRALELDDLALAAGGLDRPFGDPLAFLDEVGADEGEIVLARLGERGIDAAVDQQHRNAGLLRRHDGGDERLLLARGEEDEIDALGDHAVDVGDLLGGRTRGVGVDQLAAAFLRLVLHARGLRETPGIVAFGLGEADLVDVLLLERRHGRESGAQRGERRQADRPDQELTTIADHWVSSSAETRFSRVDFLKALAGARRPPARGSPP